MACQASAPACGAASSSLPMASSFAHAPTARRLLRLADVGLCCMTGGVVGEHSSAIAIIAAPSLSSSSTAVSASTDVARRRLRVLDDVGLDGGAG